MTGAAPTPAKETRLRRDTQRRRLAATASTLVIHGFMAAAVLLAPQPAPPIAPEPPAIELMLIAPPLPPPPPTPLPVAEADPAPKAAGAAGPKTPAPPKPAKAKPPPPQRKVAKLAPSDVPPRIVPPEPPKQITEVAVSAAELAMATTAETEGAGGGGAGAAGDGSGGGGSGSGAGGRCDMVQRLQKALRDDETVRAALLRARRAPGFTGRPLMVWNGDWIQHGDEEGKGLASLRQAIAVEVGFAPKPCRTQQMRGLVLLSLADAPGAPRVVLGAGSWRWADLLHAR